MKTPTSKPHLRYMGSFWSVIAGGVVVASWPTIDMAWQRYLEYKL